MKVTFELIESAPIDERHITHTLSRSLLENFFRILYIFADENNKTARYEELLNSFKNDYRKLLNEPLLPCKDILEVADPSWAEYPRALDVNSMLAQLKNVHGDKLDYLYFTYRIASFDTHGKNLGTIGRSVFGKTANFPFLKLAEVFELIADFYLGILHKLQGQGATPSAPI